MATVVHPETLCEPVSDPSVVVHQGGSEGGVECFPEECV